MTNIINSNYNGQRSYHFAKGAPPPRPVMPLLYNNHDIDTYDMGLGIRDPRPYLGPAGHFHSGKFFGNNISPYIMRRPGYHQALHLDYYDDLRDFNSAEEYAEYKEALKKEALEATPVNTFKNKIQQIGTKIKEFGVNVRDKFIQFCRKLLA